MEMAFVELAERLMPDAAAHARLDEIPFDVERKRLSTLYQRADGDGGLVLYTKGAPETVLPLCVAMQHREQIRPLTPSERQTVLHAQEAMAADGLRVLAFAYRLMAARPDQARLEEALIFAGLIGLEDPPRPEVPAAIQHCADAGIKVIMITGDHPHTAMALARAIGLIQGPQPTIITGDDLRRMSETQLQLALDGPEVLCARVSPDHKMRIVEALMRKGHIVAVTGDGVNDAPALRRANIGIAMGRSGTDVAREASDMILLDDNFASIINGVEEGRAVFANIKKFLTYILTSNVPELIPYIAFVLLPIPLPLTIIQILAVDLGTDMVPALALGAELPEPDAMRRPPRSARERLWSWPLLARAYLFLGVMEAAAAMAAVFFVLRQAGWTAGASLGPRDPLYLQATTACLAAIVVTQVVNVWICRSERASVLAFGPRSNPLILWGIAVELGLLAAIMWLPLGQRLFGTAPIPAGAWRVMLPFAAMMLGLEELRKWMVRARRPA
jgi:magnesium-transporting ATPase (P-type)